MRVKCICGTMGNAGTKCRSCSRIIPELEYYEPIIHEPIVEVCTDPNCDECECESDSEQTVKLVADVIKEEEPIEEEE